MKTGFFVMLVVSFSLFSCEKIKTQSHKTKKRVLDKVEKQIAHQVEKIYPRFDHNKPDTENNKKRFKDFLNVDITLDVENIYCFDIAIGFNATYIFSFNCNPATSLKIIERNKLTLDTLNINSSQLQYDFEWWDKEIVAQLPQYSWTDGKSYFKQYWYDEKNEKAYFLDFDL